MVTTHIKRLAAAALPSFTSVLVAAITILVCGGFAEWDADGAALALAALATGAGVVAAIAGGAAATATGRRYAAPACSALLLFCLAGAIVIAAWVGPLEGRDMGLLLGRSVGLVAVGPAVLAVDSLLRLQQPWARSGKGPADGRCRACGYPLHGLVSCPECGGES